MLYVGSDKYRVYVGSSAKKVQLKKPMPNYLKFTALESGTFTLTIDAPVSAAILQSVSYSVDNGVTWVTTNNSSSAVTITTPTVQAGGSVLWKGLGVGTSYSYADNGKSAFSSTGTFNVSGNLLSLLYGDNFENYSSFDSSANGTPSLFRGCTTVVDASDLILPSGLVNYCFYRMFHGCSGLVSAPKRIAADAMAQYSCQQMFYNCSSLLTPPELPTTTLAGACYYYMFYGCTLLGTAPKLSATTLITGCYRMMYRNCSSLNYIVMLSTDIPSGTLNNWVGGVAATGIFVKNIDATWDVSGVNGVPEGWTVIYYDIDEDKYYLDQQKTTECDAHGNALQYYYIYRTSSNIIERRSTFKHPTVNFPAIAGNNYCGVFTDYGGKGTVAAAILNGDPVTFVDDRVWDDGSGYIGESNVSGAAQMFNISNAITTGTTAYTPTVGTIYYVKERVDWTIQRFQYFYPTGSTSTPTYVFLVTGIDGLAYNSATMYFKEESQSEFEAINLTIASSLKISSVTLKCYSQFRTKGCITDNTGYLCYTNIKSKVEAGKNYIYYFEFETLDGIAVHSSIKHKLKVTGTTKGSFAFEDIPFDTLAFDSQVEYIELSSDNCNIPIDEYNANTRRFEIDAYIPPTSSDGWLVGSMLADGTKMYAFTPCDENGLSSYKIGDATSPTSLKLEGRYTFSNMANVSECVVTNGTDTITYTSGGTNAVNYLPIYLLGLNEGGGGRKTIKGIKLYSAKFYTVASSGTTTLVKDLVPVRKDGRGYLYDKVDELQLYAPKGDPITVYGADVVE